MKLRPLITSAALACSDINVASDRTNSPDVSSVATGDANATPPATCLGAACGGPTANVSGIGGSIVEADGLRLTLTSTWLAGRAGYLNDATLELGALADRPRTPTTDSQGE